MSEDNFKNNWGSIPMKKIKSLLPLIFGCILMLSSCAFVDDLFNEYFEGKSFVDEGIEEVIEEVIEEDINITITPYDGYDYPGPSDYVTLKANTYPQINWKVEGVGGIVEYWIFVYSPVLYNEGLTAAVLPDVWVVEDISPSLSSNKFGNIPPGAYEWTDPVFQPLKYNGTYIFWIAACDEYNYWIGMGMAEVMVWEGIDPPASPPPVLK